MSRINTAIRPFFCPTNKDIGQIFFEDTVSFDWHSGMSWQVRQRSSDSLRDAILNKYSGKGLVSEEILEVSTASHNYEVGQALSAMNLMYTDYNASKTYPVENWFHSSKVFQKDGKEYGPYRDLLDVRLAKRYLDQNLDRKTAEKLCGDPLFDAIQSEITGATMCAFRWLGEEYPLIPRSAFYDYLYVSALRQPQNEMLASKLLSFRVFTDIMFNPGSGVKRRFNTQARSCAIYVALAKRGLVVSAMPRFEDFVSMVGYTLENQNGQGSLQGKLF